MSPLKTLGKTLVKFLPIFLGTIVGVAIAGGTQERVFRILAMYSLWYGAWNAVKREESEKKEKVNDKACV